MARRGPNLGRVDVETIPQIRLELVFRKFGSSYDHFVHSVNILKKIFFNFLTTYFRIKIFFQKLKILTGTKRGRSSFFNNFEAAKAHWVLKGS